MCLRGQGMELWSWRTGELRWNCPDREGDNRRIIFVRLRGRSCQVGGGGWGAEEVWRSQCDLKGNDGCVILGRLGRWDGVGSRGGRGSGGVRSFRDDFVVLFRPEVEEYTETTLEIRTCVTGTMYSVGLMSVFVLRNTLALSIGVGTRRYSYNGVS